MTTGPVRRTETRAHVRNHAMSRLPPLLPAFALLLFGPPAARQAAATTTRPSTAPTTAPSTAPTTAPPASQQASVAEAIARLAELEGVLRAKDGKGLRDLVLIGTFPDRE